MNIIKIDPVSVWTSQGQKTATALEIRHVGYDGKTAVADCHLHGPEGEISSFTANATELQCQGWADDAPFYGEIARNVDLSPDSKEELFDRVPEIVIGP